MPSGVQPLSYQEAFARHGFLQGYPLWNPEPVLLPRGRQIDGLKIGDVGTIDGDGCFNSVLNICNPLDLALKREHGFPSNFTRIRKPIIVDYKSFPPCHVFSSPEASWFHRSVEAPFYTDERTVDNGRVITQYTANLSEDGAHIIVPQGARCSKLAPQDYSLFQSQANIHWSTWINFASSRLVQSSPSSLYLITGLCRTRSWSIASFNRKDGQEVPMSCELVEKDKKLQVDASCWTPLGRFSSGIGPSIGSQVHNNQVVFIQSFAITSNGIVPPPNQGQITLSSKLDTTHCNESLNREAMAQAAHPAGSAQHGDESNSGVTPGRTTLARENSVTIQHIPQAIQPSHPSEIINQYLLMKEPSAKVAVTHDSTWITMLARGQLSKLQDLENTLDSIVSEHYLLVLRNGVVYLRNKNVSLARFEVDQSNLPIDLTDCIKQEDEEPFARCPFGNIYRGSLCTPNGNGSPIKVAIKVIITEHTNDSSHPKKERQAQHMIEVFSALDHVNVLPLIWTTIEPGRFTMVSPWAEKGMLTSYLDDLHGELTDVQILTLIHDVAAGLDYLHSELILHGSLSGSSILIDVDGTALLADFGLSTLLDEHGSPPFIQSEWALGTVRWAAPECLTVVQDGITSRSVPTKEGDIYSFGGIMLQILSGKVPYHYYERDEEVVFAISRGEIPKRPNGSRVTDNRWIFIQQCWSSLSTVSMRPLSKDIVEFAKNDLKGANISFPESHPAIGVPPDRSGVTTRDTPSPEKPALDDTSASNIAVTSKSTRTDLMQNSGSEVLNASVKELQQSHQVIKEASLAKVKGMEPTTHFSQIQSNSLQVGYRDDPRRRFALEMTCMGPANSPVWLAIAYLNGVEWGRGTGRSRGAAKEAAVERVLIALGAPATVDYGPSSGAAKEAALERVLAALGVPGTAYDEVEWGRGNGPSLGAAKEAAAE